MSHSRKHVKASVLQDCPEITTDEEKLAKVVELRGANICQVEFPDGEKTLCQIPQKFRKFIWIKTGNFVIVREPKNLPNVKIRAMVEHVLFPEHVKQFKSQNKWPQEFEEPEVKEAAPASKKKRSEDISDEDQEDDLLFFNPNHQLVRDSDSEEEEEEDEDEEDDE